MSIEYKHFSSDGQKALPDGKDYRWWKASDANIPEIIEATCDLLRKAQSGSIAQCLTSAGLYGNVSIMGLNAFSKGKAGRVQARSKDRLSYNVIQAAVDTIVSKMAKNKPKPLFLTTGGNYKIQRKAGKLDKFVSGIFYENQAYDLSRTEFRDACLFGTGVDHIFPQYGRVKMERVPRTELLVDEIEAFFGQPRQIHREKNVDRMVLCDLYPQKEKQIINVNKASSDKAGLVQNVSDEITVRDSYHLPSGPEAKDGLHVVTAEGVLLFKEEWKKDYFPYAMFHWSEPIFGYWGQSLAEQIQPNQLGINRVLWLIDRSIHLMGSFKIWCKNGTKIPVEHFNNEIGSILFGDECPQYLTPSPVPAEYYQWARELKAGAFEQAGISQLSAESKKPEGLDSGKALREFNDIESDRFMTIGQAYERYHLVKARMVIDCAKDIYEEKGEFKVKSPNNKIISEIDWKDVALENDDFIMQVYPVSAFSEEPSAKFQEVKERVQAGFISVRVAKRLMQTPDLEQEDSLENSQETLVHQCLEKIIDSNIEEEGWEDKAFTAPEPYFNLELCIELGLEYYAQGKVNGLEEEKLNLLRRWIDQAQALIKKSLPPVLPTNPAPQAKPEPQPTSGLVPNVPVA